MNGRPTSVAFLGFVCNAPECNVEVIDPVSFLFPGLVIPKDWIFFKNMFFAEELMKGPWAFREIQKALLPSSQTRSIFSAALKSFGASAPSMACDIFPACEFPRCGHRSWGVVMSAVLGRVSALDAAGPPR